MSNSHPRGRTDWGAVSSFQHRRGLTSSQRAHRRQTLYSVAALVPALRVGGTVYKVASGSRLLGTASRYASAVKRPGHSMLLGRAKRDMGWLGGPWSPRAISSLERSMAVRKKVGLGLLGYSVVNPLENVNYIRKGDWTRLAINYHLPIIGVPIYNMLTRGSGAPTAATPTRTNRPRGRRQQPGGKGRTRPNRLGGKGWSPAPGTRKSSSSGGKGRYGKQRCPPGHYWSKRYKKCVRYRKH